MLDVRQAVTWQFFKHDGREGTQRIKRFSFVNFVSACPRSLGVVVKLFLSETKQE